MADLSSALAQLDVARQSLSQLDLPLTVALCFAAGLLAAVSLAAPLAHFRRSAIALLLLVLLAGEAALVRLHLAIYDAAIVVDPRFNNLIGRVAVPLWIESEKLYVWALMLSAIALLVRRQRERLLPILGVLAALLTGLALIQGKPFAEPLPRFFAQYRGYAEAMRSADLWTAFGAFRGMQGAREGYYNAWYMWVHPPLLFAAYGAFVVSFAALARAIPRRDYELESLAGGWARVGYLPLTAGILLGIPWALMAWKDQAWWWSGKINMSLMMWLLYSAWLHARLYLRRPGMWAVSAGLGLASFVALVLTYLTTYFVPGAHSVA